MIKRNALGRGLDSLISMPDVAPAAATAINEIEIDNIHPNPGQPRSIFDEEALAELAASIRELGIIQPLSLRALDTGGYQIIAGERRWRAARMAGLHTVPAYVRAANDTEVTEMALIENIQREDLNAIEVALGFKALIDRHNLTQERLSERLGKKRATIANHLRLLRLPADIQLGLRDGKLDMGHARALLAVADPKRQLDLYNRIVAEGLSVRAVERLAREAGEKEADQADEQHKSDSLVAEPEAVRERMDAYTRQLGEWLPLPSKLKRRPDGKGTLTLKFDSDEQLNTLMEVLGRLGQTNAD